MPGTSDHGARKRRTRRDRTALWKRIGAFVRARREELGLSQGQIISVLGYKSRNAVSNIEVGIEGLPAKRAYAWADVLELPRDPFFRFVTGEVDQMEIPKAAAKADGADRTTVAERALLATYRKLPPKYQRRLREQADEFATLARARRTKKS
ncbi:MAG: helix-turn-helix transcriptional regulator [Deltaproteobacteria bacterium]|nr:helix-turn-helix transcriptional regulator [Deltaproteobacteria bacterium]